MCVYLDMTFCHSNSAPFVICSMFEQSNLYLFLTFSFKNILNRGIKQVN